jgi:hypothetical protein
MLSSGILNDKRGILGLYKQSGLTDPDAIYAKKNELLFAHAYTRKMAKIMMWVSLPMMLIYAGFIILPLAYMAFRSANKKIALVESATLDYCREIGIDTV